MHLDNPDPDPASVCLFIINQCGSVLSLVCSVLTDGICARVCHTFSRFSLYLAMCMLTVRNQYDYDKDVKPTANSKKMRHCALVQLNRMAIFNIRSIMLALHFLSHLSGAQKANFPVGSSHRFMLNIFARKTSC